MVEIEKVLKCAKDPGYFIDQFCFIEDKVQRRWVRFKLWEAQREAVRTMAANRQVVVLKARQLGLTWLAVGLGLWTMLFQQGSGVLLFSRREDEAGELKERTLGMHSRLLPALQGKITVDNAQELRMGGIGSWARCFPTGKHSGRSYAATLAIVDEADFIPNLQDLMNAVLPTVDSGGRLVLISTANKDDPSSTYKRIWRGAVKGANGYAPVFLPWSAHPGRDAAWYARQAQNYEVDDLRQEYPASPEEALAGRESSKRFKVEWLTRCRPPYNPPFERTNHPPDALRGKGGCDVETDIPGLKIYKGPERGREYLVSADPAEGNPSSDPSAAVVLDYESWEEVAVVYGHFEPDIFAGYLVQAAAYYNGARILVERNNHGHAVLLALDYAGYERIYVSPIDRKAGWLSTRREKVLAVDNAAKVLREGCCRINDAGTLAELANLEAATLKAPTGEHDDLAMAFINGLAGLRWTSYEEVRGEGVSMMIKPVDPLDDLSF